jgi:4-hydroxy-tetrahydrodipicolinate reductase
MKIVLLGYGKMGKAIEAIAIERGHQIAATVDNAEEWNTQIEVIKNADVAIDFSRPETVLENIQKCFDINLPIVVGTTGWHDQIDRIKAQCENENKKLIFASNFSIGVNIFFNINQQLAKLMNPHSVYDVHMNETHHTEKLDAPSGTAISLANDIIGELDRKTAWNEEAANKEEEMAIYSHREKDVIGTHWITYDSDIDFIEIKHHAKNRKGFALGAVVAAELSKETQGFKEFKELLF